jgi:predicted dehydrogenase
MSTETPTPPIRWGILGAGSIAKRFVQGVQVLPDARVVAVGSRDRTKADAFADPLDIPRRHGSYEDLVADPEVDVIYVATPHPFHKDNSILALEAGKHVLCEKPFTINAAELEAIVRVARERKRFLMEGMWSRFFPAMVRLREMVNGGAIGEVRMVQSDFGFRAGVNPEGRLFKPALGGGALLDVGVYSLSFASMLLGTPDRISGLATLGETGVDEIAGLVLGYPSGAISMVATAVRANTHQESIVTGTDGRIVVHSPWWNPSALTVFAGGKGPERIEAPFEGNGFNYEAAEVGRCVRAGALESPVMPLDESLAILRTMDAFRAQIGLKYPME